MLKRLRLKFIMAASLMLVLMLGAYHEAKAQVCPGVDFTTGHFRLNVSNSSPVPEDFTAGLLGLVEDSAAGVTGGLDWLYNSAAFFDSELSGSQIVSWWTQANGRNTSLQVTNSATFSSVNVHVIIFGPDCREIRNFCDFYTAEDTHVYDLGNLVDNGGAPIPVGTLLDDTEGIILATAVNNCTDLNAISFNSLAGTTRIIDSGLNVDYGTNAYSRLAVFFESQELVSTGTTLDGINTELRDLSSLTALNGQLVLRQNFDVIGAGPAAADLVLISFFDSFGPPYSIIPGAARYRPIIFNDAEFDVSCRDFPGCFLRVGIDDAIPVSDGFATPTPTPTPSVCFDDEDCEINQTCEGGQLGECSVSGDDCETDADCTGVDEVCNGAVAGTCEDIPCTSNDDCPPGTECDEEAGFCVVIPVSPTPTPDGGGGGGGGCAVAGPVSVGTAMANIILPLIPVAFAFGLGALRRRNRKEDISK